MTTTTGEGRTAARTRRVATLACWLAVALAAAWAMLRLGWSDRGPMVQAVAFTPYVAAGSLVPLVVALALRRRGPAVVAAATALVLIAAVAPRAVAATQPAVDGPALRLLTANLLKGSVDPGRLVGLVREHRVDVLTVQEFTPQSAAELDRLGLAALLPYRVLNPEVGTTGSAVYARFPLSDGGFRRNQGFLFTQAYGTLAVPGAPPVRVESAHPAAPWSVGVVPDWRTDLRGQPPATPRGRLSILAGDFNATLDHAPLRELIATGYVDAADAAGAGLAGTWGPYDGDPIPPVTIDHVLADRRIAVRSVAVYALPGSDHRAVLAELRLPAV
ncbi:endonuclease/exonuclease/phosphatase family protein [Micromonospora viridifaciens]|uniref:endonuclease/exonuclease/phosphatase family protein n=1 Tax=Micromonospora viridifaciens TaxID=1881 RepID=UPI0038B3A0B8